MCELAIISRGSRWILLDADAWEIAQFGSEADALSAATGYVRAGPAFVLVGGIDGEWREERLEPLARH
jgi:hypothetical protein